MFIWNKLVYIVEFFNEKVVYLFLNVFLFKLELVFLFEVELLFIVICLGVLLFWLFWFVDCVDL